MPTWADKLVADYARVSVFEAQGIEICAYKQLLRDAYICYLRQTEEGRERLAQAWRLEQAEPAQIMSGKIGGRGGGAHGGKKD